MASTDAIPLARKNVAYRLYFGIYKNDGTLITGATALDSEVSKDGAAFADCTNEATEISQGAYYLDLTSTEMNADNVFVVVKTSSTGAVVPTFSINPQETGDFKVDVNSLLGTAWLTPGTAGTPDVNVKLWNGLTTVALPLTPTTAGRTLDVSAGGEAGIDWANVGSPATVVGLSGTTVKTATDVETDTQDIQSRIPAALVGGRMDSSVGAMAANVMTAAAAASDLTTELQNGLATATALATLQTSVDDLPTNAELATALAAADDAVLAAIAALNNLSAAQVNAEVVDALATDTYAEPGQGAPSATTSLAAKINYLFKAWRNKTTQTATTYSLYADDAATVDQKATVSDDATTMTRGEVVSGP